MKYSKIGRELEFMKINHSHEMDLLKMKQEMNMNELLTKCPHVYDDDSSAIEFGGTQWDSYYVCGICGKPSN